MVCVSVKYRQTWHAYADGHGDGSYLNKFGNFRGSKFQKSGKFHELPRKSINIFLPPPVGILGGQKIKSPGNVMNGREKS